jgi:hypothetical protein
MVTVLLYGSLVFSVGSGRTDSPWGKGGSEWVGIRRNEKVNSVKEAFIKNMSSKISSRNLTRWDQISVVEPEPEP